MKNNLMTFEELCYQHFINSNGDIKKMEAYAKDLRMSISNFLLSVNNYIINNVNEPEYVKILDKLFECNDKEHVIRYLDSVNMNYKYLDNNLEAYFKYYRPFYYYLHPERIDALREKLTIYDNYQYRKLDPSRVDNSISEDENAINMVREFVTSKYSSRRFCFNNKLTMEIFRKNVKKVSKLDNDLYNLYLENIDEKYKIMINTITDDVKKIFKLIKTNPNFSIVDFCLATNYDVSELIGVVDNVLPLEDAKLFRKTLRQFKENDVLNGERLTRLFKTDFTFDICGESVTVTDEDKYAAITYLYNNSIPVCNASFLDCLGRIYNKRNSNVIKQR